MKVAIVKPANNSKRITTDRRVKMDLGNRDLITIDDLTNAEIESILFPGGMKCPVIMLQQYGLCAW